MKGGIDRGFCFSYSSLSHRRKFLRTLWVGPVMSALLWLGLESCIATDGPVLADTVRRSYCGLAILLQVVYAGQLTANHRRWQQQEAARQLA